MRTRTLLVTPEMDGRTVHDLMKNELLLSEALISRLKRRESGVLVDGVRAYTTRRVSPGERLTVEVGDAPDAARPAPIPSAFRRISRRPPRVPHVSFPPSTCRIYHT